MARNSYKVDESVDQGVILLILTFNPEFLLEKGAGDRLGTELAAHYRRLLSENQQGQVTTPSCIVQFEPEIAGSTIVRALFELWKEVNRNKGQLVIFGYPNDFIPSLTSLGLPSLSGFTLANSKQDAFSRLQL